MAPKRRNGTYKGALAKAIMLHRPPAFWGAVVPKRIAAYERELSRHERANETVARRQFSRKLLLLFDHYNIPDKKDMAALAWALAFEHVPGFKIQFPELKSRKGRKPKWFPERLEKLYRTVQSIKQQHHFTDRLALTFIVNNQEHAANWGVPQGHRGSKEQWIETLESRLQDAKRLQKLADQAERDLRAIAASKKFRK